MQVTTAMALIENLAYKPGWEFEVRDNSHRFEESIVVTMCCDTFQSERADAAEGYPNAIRPRASFCIMVGQFADDCELYRALMEKVICYETHEAREFLRVKPTMWAPFHPHKVDGQHRWGTPAEDVVFGIA